MELYKRIKARREKLGMSQEELATKLGYKSRSTINKIEMGKNDITQSKIIAFANALQTTPSYLMGLDEHETEIYTDDKFPNPNITEDYTTFPVICDIAKGYNNIAIESWIGDKVDIPNSYLKGHTPKDFFVLCIKGDSMYPQYQDGDKVLILRQSTVNYSGDVGAVIYNDEISTLKKIEFVEDEDWLRLVPVNPNVPPILIAGEELKHCRIMGVPKLLIREM